MVEAQRGAAGSCNTGLCVHCLCSPCSIPLRRLGEGCLWNMLELFTLGYEIPHLKRQPLSLLLSLESHRTEVHGLLLLFVDRLPPNLWIFTTFQLPICLNSWFFHSKVAFKNLLDTTSDFIYSPQITSGLSNLAVIQT